MAFLKYGYCILYSDTFRKKMSVDIKYLPIMWWRYIALVKSIFVINILLLPQFDNMKALQSPIFIRSFFSEHPLMDYPV